MGISLTTDEEPWGRSFSALPQNASIKIFLIASFLSLAILTLYFRFFPTIYSPMISDILLVTIVIVLFLSFTLGILYLPKDKLYLLLVPMTYVAVLFRLVRALRVQYPPLWDPYAHLIAYQNILNHGLTAEYVNWLTPLPDMLPWPGFHILSIILTEVNGAGVWWAVNYTSPLLGIALFWGVILVAKSVQTSLRTAVAAALITICATHPVFYLSEFHPQGFSLVLLVFSVATIIRQYGSRLDSRIILLTSLFLATLFITHYFSTLFVAVVLSLIGICIYLGHNLEKVEIWPFSFELTLQNLPIFFAFTILVLIYHFEVNPTHIESYLASMLMANPYGASLTGSSSATPIISLITRNVRWAVLGLATVSLIGVFISQNKKRFVLAAFIGLLLILGVLGQYGIFLEVGRVVTFYQVLVGVFAALTLRRVATTDIVPLQRFRTIAVGVILIIVLTASAFGGMAMPAYYFQSVEESDHYWNQNRVPEMAQYPSAGDWINQHRVSGNILTDAGRFGFTNSFVYWGRISDENIMPRDRLPSIIRDNPGLDYRYAVINQYYDVGPVAETHSRLYSNGEIAVYSDRQIPSTND